MLLDRRESEIQCLCVVWSYLKCACFYDHGGGVGGDVGNPAQIVEIGCGIGACIFSARAGAVCANPAQHGCKPHGGIYHVVPSTYAFKEGCEHEFKRERLPYSLTESSHTFFTMFS